MYFLTLLLFVLSFLHTVLSGPAGDKSVHAPGSPIREHNIMLFGQSVSAYPASRTVHSAVEHGKGTSSVQHALVEPAAPSQEEQANVDAHIAKRMRKVRGDKGKPRKPWSEERRKAAMELREETCKKISEAKRGKPWTQARRDAERQMRLDGRARTRARRLSEARQRRVWSHMESGRAATGGGTDVQTSPL